MSKKKAAPAATAETFTEGKDGLKTTTPFFLEGPAAPPGYTGPWAEVSFECSVTVPTGAYQNAKPGVRITLPVHPQRIDEAFEFAVAWCDARLGEVRAAIENPTPPETPDHETQ